MSDYIEREAVLAYPIRKDKCDRKHANEHFILGIESVIEFVENLPAADVAPVVHARWGDYEAFPLAPSMNGYPCGNCGMHFSPSVVPVLKYCPNCGAKMDKEEV